MCCGKEFATLFISYNVRFEDILLSPICKSDEVIFVIETTYKGTPESQIMKQPAGVIWVLKF